jgi:hypothetical protein
LTPPTLCLSGAAKRDWISYHDDVERELGRTGDFGNVQDFAAKTAENAARIAALLHIFEHGPGGEISQDLIQAGAALASWHLFEAKRIIGATEAPESISDARLLLDWIIAQDPKTITPRHIQQFAPSRLRDKRRRDAALGVLLDTFHLSEERGDRGTAYRLQTGRRECRGLTAGSLSLETRGLLPLLHLLPLARSRRTPPVLR